MKLKTNSSTKYFLKTIVIIALFTACNKNKHIVILNDNIESFSEFPKNEKVLFKEIAEFKKGEPYSMVLTDSILIIENSKVKKGYNFYNYNIKSNVYSKGYVQKGRGPNEVQSSTEFGVHKNIFWMYDGILKKILQVNKDSLFLGVADNFQWFPTDQSYYSMAFVKNNKYVVNGNRYSKIKIQEFDLDKNIESNTYGTFDIPNRNTPIDGVKAAYQAFLLSKPSGDKVVMAYRRVDAIELFDLKNEANNKVVRGPISNELKLKFQKKGVINLFLKDKEIINTFVGGTVTDKYIYLPFSGKKKHQKNITDIKFNYNYAKYIHVYDWDGNPVKKIILDRNIMAIAVSKDDKTLYSFDPNSGYILKADIK